MKDGVDSVDTIMHKFKIDRDTYNDIETDREKLEISLAKLDESLNKKLKSTNPADDKIELATYKWYLQMKARGVTVHGSDIQKAAETIAEHFGQTDFKASTDWLLKFHTTHNFAKKQKTPIEKKNEKSNGDNDIVSAKVAMLVKDGDYSEYHLYNADETGLFWKAMPDNTTALKHLPVAEINKQRLTALMCTNGDGSHKLKPLVIGSLKNRRALRNVADELPVTYKSSSSAQMTTTVFSDWFHYSFVPSVREYQQSSLNVLPENIKAVLLLDSAHCHPNSSYLESHDGHIKVFSIPNTSCKLQPMEQGIMESCKRYYRKYQLDDCLVFMKAGNGGGGGGGCGGSVGGGGGYLEASTNLRTYSIKDALYNWSRAWTDLPIKTIKKSWLKILQKKEIAMDNTFDGLKSSDYLQLLHVAGDEETSIKDVKDWLTLDAQDFGHDEKCDSETAAELCVTGVNTNVLCEVDCILDDDETIEKQKSVNLPEAKSAMDHVIRVIDNPRFPKMHKYFTAAKEIRSTITESIISCSAKEPMNFNFIRDDPLPYKSSTMSGSYGSRHRLKMPKFSSIGERRGG